MKRLAILMTAVLPLITVSGMATAIAEEPDPLTADLQLVIPTEEIVSNKADGSKATDYEYGDKLDIREVISVKSDPMACGITPEVMMYKDSKGDVRTLRYEVMGKGCQNG